MIFNNFYLLKKHNAYINIKVCFYIKTIIHLYRYIYNSQNIVDILIILQFHKIII